MICDRVLPSELAVNWPEFSLVLAATPDTWYTWWTLESIRDRITSGEAQLWVVRDGEKALLWFMTEILTFPRKKELCIWWASGAQFLRCVSAVIPVLRTYARHVGARTLIMVGRPGFEKWLKPHGIKVQVVTYSMEMLDG